MEIRRCTSDEFEEEKAKVEAMNAILKTKIMIEEDENDCLLNFDEVKFDTYQASDLRASFVPI